jgi:DNA-nicking Smr family endonuclease
MHGRETPREGPEERTADDDGAVELPIDGSLDLHPFHPRDVASVVEEYLDDCGRRGIRSVRIAHGKGIGTLREIVHGVLRRRPDVLSYRLDAESAAGWGATLVELRGRDQSAD